MGKSKGARISAGFKKMGTHDMLDKIMKFFDSGEDDDEKKEKKEGSSSFVESFNKSDRVKRAKEFKNKGKK